MRPEASPAPRLALLGVLLAAAAAACGAPARPSAASASPSTVPARSPSAASSAATPAPPPTTLEEPPDEEPHDDSPELEEELSEWPEALPPARHPLDGVPVGELERRFRSEPATLGSVSIGKPSAGSLMNGVRMPSGDLWQLTDPGNAYGTEETVAAVVLAVTRVAALHPGTPRIWIGHLSRATGGPLRPHRSHQSGRDVDLGLYYASGGDWYRRATPESLDAARTWTLIRTLVTETDVDFILLDRSLHEPVRRHALAAGEPELWVRSLFDGGPGRLPPLVRHAPGHATHLHVRFQSPVARETARRLHPVLQRSGRAGKTTTFVTHRARKGDTLGSLARRHGTTVAELRAANGLRSDRIVAGRVYRIPRAGGPVEAPREPVRVLPRRLPSLVEAAAGTR